MHGPAPFEKQVPRSFAVRFGPLVLFCGSAVPGISATPTEDNLRYFQVIIIGPVQSPYEGAAPLGPTGAA
eukprot:SAG22_NODE_13752_length_396_cov_0.696970_1_plen_69_part_01